MIKHLKIVNVVAVVVVVVVSAGCGERPLQHEPVVCPPADEVPRYGALTAMTSCTGCHSSMLAGDARNGAPLPINFDTYADASRAAVIGLGAVTRGAMPPDDIVDDDDVEQWAIWSSCGRPE